MVFEVYAHSGGGISKMCGLVFVILQVEPQGGSGK